MWIMGAHKMFQVGATGSGSVDGDSYDPQNLCDNDPHSLIRTAAGSFSFTIARSPGLAGINGLVITNHNLDAGKTVSFTGLGDITTLDVPPDDIRLTAYARLATPVAGTTTTTDVASSGHAQACIVGEILIGVFEELFAIAPRPGITSRGFGLKHPGDFGGMDYARGAFARDPISVTADLTADEFAILDACYKASWENSRPTVIIPYDESPDAWVVKWEQYVVSPEHQGYWPIAVTWSEIARFRLPA